MVLLLTYGPCRYGTLGTHHSELCMGGWAINPYLAYMGTADDCNAATEALYAALRECLHRTM